MNSTYATKLLNSCRIIATLVLLYIFNIRHINKVVKALHEKARQAFILLQKTNTDKNASLTFELLDILVLPVQTYRDEVWGPFMIADKNFIKILNHTFKRMLELTVIERLNLQTLKLFTWCKSKSTYKDDDIIPEWYFLVAW